MTLEKNSLNGQKEALHQCGRLSDVHINNEKKYTGTQFNPREGQLCFL